MDTRQLTAFCAVVERKSFSQAAERLGVTQPAVSLQIRSLEQRLVVRPGLTGFAQVRRGYETSMAEKLAHDLEWIADRSVRLYLRTLATTAVRVLRQFLRGLIP